MKRHSFAIALVLLMALLAAVPAASRTDARSLAQALTVTKDTVSTITGKNQVPRATIAGNQLYVGWKYGLPPGSVTAFSQRSEAPGPWPRQESLGGASDGTYLTSSVAVSPKDGSVQIVWADFTAGARGQLFHSRKQANGQWTTPVRVSTGSTFVHYPHMTIDTNGRVWAIWSAENPVGNSNVYFRYSDDNGVTWKPDSQGLIDSDKADNAWIAADRSGGVYATWARYDGGVYYGRWNGSSWVIAGIPSGGYNSQPTITVDPSNNVHVAWRRQAGFGIWDVYYATKPTIGGSFRIQKLYSGDNINFAVVIFADDLGTLHLTWFDSPKGGEIWYSNKPPGGSWLSPAVNVTNDSRFNVNADVVGASSGGIRGHVFYQTFYSGDSDVRIEHSQVGNVVIGPGAQPTIKADIAAGDITNDSPVTVTFSNVTANPNKIRYRWDGQPTAADPQLDFSPAAATLQIPAPTGIQTTACETHTLYTKAAAGTNEQATASSDTVTFDTAVQAKVDILNRHLAILPASYGVTTSDVFAGSGGNGASDGDPNYTRESSFFLRISGQIDCSGLKTYNVPGSESGTLTNSSYIGTPALPGGSAPGPRTISVEVTDNLNHTQTSNKTLVYDPADTDPSTTISNTQGLPVLASGGSVSADDAKSIIRELSFSGINVSDNLFGDLENLPDGRQFWGVWIANSTKDNDQDNPALNWYPVRVETPNSSFKVKWDLFSGLGFTSDLRNKSGDYYVYVRFLDGAGNPSSGFIKTKVTLAAGYEIPTVLVPLTNR